MSSSEIADGGEQRYETVTCLACGQVHLVDPRSGKVVGEEND